MPSARLIRTVLLLLLVAAAVPASAQQTGSIAGRIVDSDGLALPGVTVVATSNVMPAPRNTVTGGAGEYRLPALLPGEYTLSFELAGMATVTRKAVVQLGQDTFVDVTLSIAGLTETVEVVARSTVIDREAATIKSAVGSDQIQQLPIGQQYRDLLKLIPGVMYTQDGTRGPSAGGSGQDNTYNFDGVNVTTPLFGTLGAEPASYDIAQVTTTKGGATAVNFERSGGFSIDSVSKSGTNRFSGMFSYQFQTPAMTAALVSTSASQYEQTLKWTVANIGGPVVRNKVYFYASYYRPEVSRANRANLYGELPDYNSTRNEGFGKVTVTPISALLFNASYRYSDRLEKSNLFPQNASPTSGSGNEWSQQIITADGSWVVNSKSFASFKYTNYENPTQSRPDNIADVDISLTPGTRLDTANLDKIGLLTVPTLVAGADAFNAFVAPLIARYGYISPTTGLPTGGGYVGYGTLFDNDDFFRDAFQVAYNITLGTTIAQDIHVGYQWYVDSEDLLRSSNGWGSITVPGGRAPTIGINGIPAYYVARFQQQTTGAVPTIHSEFRSHNIEVNDTIRWRNWSFNAGVMFSNDKLYGQGLNEDSSTISGYVAAPGNKYLMHEIPFGDMVQPRLGATWAYDGQNTIYGSYARYYPAASSLPRAASWARNLATEIDAFFDANGVLYGVQPLAGSSGKLFQEGIKPRMVDEYIVGTARAFTSRWTGRLYYRHRDGSQFWEDTNNNARVVYDPPPDIPRELYIPNLDAMRAQIGSGSSYVIAELDGAYTDFDEVSVESEYRAPNWFLRGSYTWSRYRGNFDQDNTTTGNDANIFVGSSFIADGAGRQLWNYRDGTLRGDRPHMFKAYGYYQWPWQGTVGAFFVAQSGQPWEIWSYEPYIALTTSVSDTSRYAEPAGSRRTDSHTQLDLNYSQRIPVYKRVNVVLVADLYNVFNSQTGYNIQNAVHTANFGQPRNYFAPRVLQFAARVQF